MRKYSLDNGRIIEFESEDEKHEELEAIYKSIMRKDKNRKKPEIDESLIAIDLVCGSECSSVELINDATEAEVKIVQKAIRDFVNHVEEARMPYLVYRKSMRERICVECTLLNGKTWWRVLRMDSITSADIQYLVDVMKEVGIYDLKKL